MNYICPINKSGNVKTQTNVEANELTVLKKIDGITKMHRIIAQQIIESCYIQPISE